MFRAAAPACGAAQASLRVSGAWRREFSGASESARDPALRAYVADMLRPHAMPLAEEGLAAGQSYGEMAAALLAGEVAADGPVDLLVFAFAVPDVTPWRATASYLSHLCPGQPFAFAVCDCGVTAPFTALRLILDYASTGGCRRALLVVAEQAGMPYRPAVPAATPARHAVVTLMCDQSGPGGVAAVRLQASVARSDAGGLLAGAVADLSAGYEVTTVIGAGLAGDIRCDSLPGQVVIAPPEQPCTGVWWEAAGRLREWAATGGGAAGAEHGAPGAPSTPGAPGAPGAPGSRVLLADYDPLLERLCLATIEIPGAPGRQR